MTHVVATTVYAQRPITCTVYESVTFIILPRIDPLDTNNGALYDVVYRADALA